MHTDVDCLGRISVSPRLLAIGSRRGRGPLHALDADPLGLVLRQYCDRETVVAELRAMIDGHFRPAGFLLHGMVVAQTEEGDVFTVAARRNRVSSRHLWTAADAPAPDTCRVIELDRRRRREGGPRPAGRLTYWSSSLRSSGTSTECSRSSSIGMISRARAFVDGEHDRGGHAVVVGLQPAGRDHAPPVTRLQPGELPFRPRRRQVVADRALVSRNSVVTTAHTACRPTSSSPHVQSPSR